VTDVSGPGPWRVARAGPEAAIAMARIAATGIPRAWSARAFANELASSGGEGWLARPVGAPGAPPVGELLLHRVLDEAEIRSLGVLPAARRRGAASALLGVALAHATAAGVRVFHLEVRAGNAAARALYQDLGFAVVGRRPRYYPDGEAALLLSRGSEAAAVAGRAR